MKQGRLMYTLDEFYENYDIDVNAHSNNDVMVVINENNFNEVIKVLQDGINILCEN